jgi:hypothetical protein
LTRITSRYKFIVEALGLKQLDVYRVVERGREVDVLRLYDPSTRKVITINIGTLRESLDQKDFLDRILKSLEEAGVRVSEKRLSRFITSK